ncbi:unnamed protein product [Adineta steineri]|uniref:Caspase family p20 domain-containing protein n=1 Tax=Adineta steineri TaxID=433720 RepID=A0A819FXI8_9BILA|nr:unnamed protein product [Adineta steineri]CAF3872908.1 unnamed protein product [Adineta steineri]
MALAVGYKRKTGLVIGINQYPRDSLQYCINDATDLANTLQSIGFEITLSLDCDLIKFRNIIDTFIKTVEPDDLVLFYFAGHGKQNDDENYLLPSDYNYDYSGHERDYIANNAINVKYIMNKIEDKTCRITVYLFDCCRSKIRTRDPDGKQGLLPMNTAAQTLIVFACAPGKAVLDETKNNKNGSFIENLLKHISTSDKDIEEVMRNVAGDVNRQTFGFQLPYRTSSLIDPVYIVTNNNRDKQTSGSRIVSQQPAGTSSQTISNSEASQSSIGSTASMTQSNGQISAPLGSTQLNTASVSSKAQQQTSGTRMVSQQPAGTSAQTISKSDVSQSSISSTTSSIQSNRQISTPLGSTQLDNAHASYKTQHAGNRNSPHHSSTSPKDYDTSMSSNSTQSL